MVSSVTRVLRAVQVESGHLRPQALAATRILGEQITQVPPADLGVVLFERLPHCALA
jgi:hypothetical protein